MKTIRLNKVTFSMSTKQYTHNYILSNTFVTYYNNIYAYNVTLIYYIVQIKLLKTIT